MKRFIALFWIVACLALTACGSDNKQDSLARDDAQNGWLAGGLTKGSRGYYYSHTGIVVDDEYVGNLMRISYMDPESQTSKVWCYKPECEHIDESCNGIFSCEKYADLAIFYNDGKLYLISLDDKGFYLESFNEDGSNQHRVCKISDRNKALYSLKLHRGYIYYSNVDGIYRVSVKDGSSECILSVEDPVTQNIDDMFIYDNMLYFPYRHTTENLMDEDAYSEVYSYNIDTKETTALFKVYQSNLLYVITFDNENLIYYKNNSGLCKHNIASGEESIIFKENNQICRNIATNGEFIFIDNSKEKIFHKELYGEESGELDTNCCIQVLTKAGELKNTFEYELWEQDFLYGEEKVFRYGSSSDGKIGSQSVWYIDAQNLANGSDQWIEGCPKE